MKGEASVSLIKLMGGNAEVSHNSVNLFYLKVGKNFFKACKIIVYNGNVFFVSYSFFYNLYCPGVLVNGNESARTLKAL